MKAPLAVEVVPKEDTFLKTAQAWRVGIATQNEEVQGITLEVLKVLRDEVVNNKRLGAEKKTGLAKAIATLSAAHTMKQKIDVELGVIDLEAHKKSPVGNRPPQSPIQINISSSSAPVPVVEPPKP